MRINFQKEIKYSFDYINSQVRYEPETGFLFWRGTGTGKKIGRPAGGNFGIGYISICFNQDRIMAHRVAWLLSTGFWPSNQIDHRNHIRSDNRIVNLREATNEENTRNRLVLKRNTSGVTGVHFHKRDRKWVAQITVDGKHKFLGYFNDLSSAQSTRKEAEKKYYKAFAPDNTWNYE